MTELIVPPGFIFEPYDEELITGYLIPMNEGRTLPCNIIRPIDVYGPNATPWEIFDHHKVEWIQSSDNKKKCYVFTTLTKKGKGNTNFDRRAGCGTWDGQWTKSVLNNQGEAIGFKKYYSFEVRGFNYAKVYGHYGMYEYFFEGRPCEIVLCVITREFSNVVEDQERLSLANNMVENIRGDVDHEYHGDQEDETTNGSPHDDQVGRDVALHVDESAPSETHGDQVALQQVVTNNDPMLQNITVDSVHLINQVNDDGVHDPIAVDHQIDFSFLYDDTLSSAGGQASVAYDQIMLEDQYNGCGNPMGQSTNCFGNQTLINNNSFGNPNWYEGYGQISGGMNYSNDIYLGDNLWAAPVTIMQTSNTSNVAYDLSSLPCPSISDELRESQELGRRKWNEEMEDLQEKLRAMKHVKLDSFAQNNL